MLGGMKQFAVKKLAACVYADSYSIRAIVHTSHGRKERRFPHGTSLRLIEKWRNETKTKLEFVGRLKVVKQIPILPRSLDGWCYLYIVAGARCVKIGRTMNPHVRLGELQTGHDEKLTLLVAVPVHASLETAVHQRFAAARRHGEWFELTDEVRAFVQHIQDGKDPVRWLWDAMLPPKRGARRNVVTTLHNIESAPEN
jgi:hypothetical protein